MKHNNENTNAFLIHISAFAFFLFPFGNIVTPLILWQTLKDRSNFLDEHGKEAVNFNISYTLYSFIASIISVPFFAVPFFSHRGNNFHFDLDWSSSFMFPIVGAFSIAILIQVIMIAIVIIAAMKANKGEMYKYPLTINFIK